jgi:hypothetical protein
LKPSRTRAGHHGLNAWRGRFITKDPKRTKVTKVSFQSAIHSGASTNHKYQTASRKAGEWIAQAVTGLHPAAMGAEMTGRGGVFALEFADPVRTQSLQNRSRCIL